MGGLSFRKLRADEIECRISILKKTGVSLLLYKDARVDQNLLDETVGPMNWQKSYSRDNANCTVSVWDEEKKQWISKEDTGKESYTEKEKGLASDSFKRACFCWGIGRELYTAPYIWVDAKDCKIVEEEGKLKCKNNFFVSQIGYDEKGNINSLKISNGYKDVFRHGAVNNVPEPEKKPEAAKKEEPEKEMATEAQIKVLRDLTAKYGLSLEMWAKAGGKSIATLTAQDAGNMLTAIKRKFGEA